MYKDLKTMIIIGSTGTGKTRLIKKYIEEIINEDNDIYIIDLKRVELFEYKDNDKVTYIEFMEDIENILNKIEKNKKKKYLFIDEYFEVRINKDLHQLVKKIIYNRRDYNIDIVLSSQNKNSFCNGMKSKVNTVINLNGYY